MPNTEIFKLFFHHDIRLDDLAPRNTGGKPSDPESTLEQFMKPDPTYSKFYLTGTDLEKEEFGLNSLSHFEQVIDALDTSFNEFTVFTSGGEHSTIAEALPELNLGEVMVLSKKQSPEFEISSLHTDTNSNVGHLKTELREVLEQGFIVIYKEQAQNGYDLHIFSENNIYRDLFFPLQKLLPGAFRFFSINNKKFRSERHFYFETWTLDKPPHGFEEVHPDSVL